MLSIIYQITRQRIRTAMRKMDPQGAALRSVQCVRKAKPPATHTWEMDPNQPLILDVRNRLELCQAYIVLIILLI